MSEWRDHNGIICKWDCSRRVNPNYAICLSGQIKCALWGVFCDHFIWKPNHNCPLWWIRIFFQKACRCLILFVSLSTGFAIANIDLVQLIGILRYSPAVLDIPHGVDSKIPTTSILCDWLTETFNLRRFISHCRYRSIQLISSIHWNNKSIENVE